MGTVLIGSGTASGALVGLVAALVAAAATGLLGVEPQGWTPAVVALGAALDAVRLVAGRPAPPTHGHQVPREWAWIFPPTVTAALFGARLGVGPLTILSTWTWWSFTVAAALHGPATAALVGATFGLARMVVNTWVSISARPSGHPALFGRLRAGRRRGWAAITLVTALLVAAGAGCAEGRSPEEAAHSARALDQRAAPDDTETNGTGSGLAEAGTASEPTGGPDLITPAELEDVVRTSIPEPTGLADSAEAPETGGSPDRGNGPDSLASSLTPAIPGYDPVDDAAADRFLDLRAAADLQPDPTEEVALLETRGFRGGWTRAFRNDGNDVAVASVYRFRDAAEAEFYLEDGLITIGGYGGTFFDIPDLPAARGFTQRISTSDGESTGDLVSLGASFSHGDRWYLLYFLGSPDTVTPDVLVPALAEQLRLAGG